MFLHLSITPSLISSSLPAHFYGLTKFMDRSLQTPTPNTSMELNYENLLSVLALADGSKSGPAMPGEENQLKKWETVQGYHYLLQKIYLDQQNSLHIRWLAIICFKNGIEKYWRPSRANAISKEEKTQIKANLFAMISEKNNQLAIQNAHLIARIVRFDFPLEWPSVFEEIAHSLEESAFKKGDMTSTNNLLIILNQVIKAVSVVRVGRARHALQSKAPTITPVLIRLYLKFFQQWTSVTMDIAIMEICYLCLKNLRRIVTSGYEQPQKDADVTEFLNISISHLKSLVLQHEQYSSLDMLERYVSCYGKLYVELINLNPTSFVQLPCSIEIISTFMSLLEQKAEAIYTSSEENPFWESLALKGFMILKKVVAFIYKKGAVVLKERNERDEVNAAISKLSTEVFTIEVIQHLCDLIIDWYLRLKPSDIEGWLLEPEEWCNEELSSSWEFQIRPCAENFFQDLVSYFRNDLSGFILNKISNGLQTQSQTYEGILTKDSILCTFQLSAMSIADSVDFDTILKTILIPEALRSDIPETRIIKRRVCLIIGEWVAIKCLRESRVDIFRLLNTILLTENKKVNDIVVRLTAIQTLKKVIDEWDFNKYDFQPFLKEFTNLSLIFLGEVNLTESKLYVTNVLAVLLYRCNPLIDQETLMQILNMVPRFWDSSSNENDSILRNSLLRVLKNLVISLNENSVSTYEISLPLIITACTGDLVQYTLLSEDGYDLWLPILQYCPENVPATKKEELMNLFPLIRHGLLNATEILPTILAILRSYALLSPQLFMGEIGESIFRTLSGYLHNMRDDAFTVFISLMDILFLQVLQSEDFVNRLMESGILNAMTNFVIDEASEIVTGNKIFLLFARIANISPTLLFKILNFLGLDESKFFGIWLDHVNNNGNPRNKKINLLALVSLSVVAIPQKHEFFITRFPEIIQKTMFFLEEVKEDDQGNCNAYKRDIIYEEVDDYCYGEPDIAPHGEKTRYLELIGQKDPVFSTNITNFIREAFFELRGSIGDGAISQMMSSSKDEYVVEKLQSIIN